MKKVKYVVIVLLFLMVPGQNAFADGDLLIRAQTNPHMDKSIILATAMDSVDMGSDNVGVDFILDILPAGMLISPDWEDFDLYNVDGDYDFESTGFASWMPTIGAGIGVETPHAYIDATLGGGVLLNDVFISNMFLGDLACRFKLGEHFTIGPHIGFARFSEPNWDEVDIPTSDSSGIMGGLALTAGTERVSASLAIDYVDASFDIDLDGDGAFYDSSNHTEWIPNSDSVDMSGVAIRVGVLLRF